MAVVGLAIAGAQHGRAVYDEVVPRRPEELPARFLRRRVAPQGGQGSRASGRGAGDEEGLNRGPSRRRPTRRSWQPGQCKSTRRGVKAEERQAEEDEAKLYLGFDKSDQDAVYYKLREARHENHAPEEAQLQKEFDEWQRKIDEKTKIYNAAIAAHKAATERRLAFVQRRDAAQAKIEKVEKPIREIDKRLEAFSGIGKLPQMEQYWISNLKNSWGSETVDRCQNCHAGINKGGFSAPWEVLAAKKANLPEAEMKAQYALDPEVIDAYQKVRDAICEDAPPAPQIVPIGGFQAPAEPAAMDPAQATECRPRAAWEKWMEQAAAYCGPRARLAKTKTVQGRERRGARRAQAGVEEDRAQSRVGR